STMGRRRFVIKAVNHDLQKTGIPPATGFAPVTDKGRKSAIFMRLSPDWTGVMQRSRYGTTLELNLP
ncbi:hypothetical protein, partial [Agrobacterium tumefaciens]|uniref:hypothetical protein n=1 Tax=Agrobacterium tumefaciens TaxID=358 RepID=UPI001B8A8B9A